MKRGRTSVHEQLPDAAHDEWLRQIGALCKQGESVTAQAAAAVGRAVVEAKAPSVLQRHGGSFLQRSAKPLTVVLGCPLGRGLANAVQQWVTMIQHRTPHV